MREQKKMLKNEGRTDYVYESTGSSDKKYFGKTAFCLPFGARPRAPLGDIMPSESRVPHAPHQRMRSVAGKVSFSIPTDFDGTLDAKPGHCPNLHVAPPSWRLDAGWKPALHLKLGYYRNPVELTLYAEEFRDILPALKN